MTLEQTLPISEAAMFQPISNSLSTKDNTGTYLLIGAGLCLVVLIAYQYGKHQGLIQYQLIKPNMEPRADRENLPQKKSI